MTREEALNSLKEEMKNFTFSDLKDEKDVYLFLAETNDPNSVPNKLVCGVNKETGAKGYSVFSVEAVVEACRS